MTSDVNLKKNNIIAIIAINSNKHFQKDNDITISYYQYHINNIINETEIT